MNDDLRRLLRLARRMARRDGEPPVPPALPPGRAVLLPGRGETFVREQPGPVDAVPVLLLHGWTATADVTWFPVFSVLDGRHRVVALDHRGHGRGIRSEVPFSLEACADDAAALLDVLGAAPAVVAGYSLGGAVAMLLWKRHRPKVAGLVLMATALEWRSSPRERLAWRGLTALELALRMGTGDGFVQRYLRQAAEQSPEVVPLRPWVAGELRRGHPGDVAAAGKALSDFDARPCASSVDVPTAVVITTRDILVRPAKQHELARALGARVFPLDADHDAPLVRAKEFGDVAKEAVAAVTP